MPNVESTSYEERDNVSKLIDELGQRAARLRMLGFYSSITTFGVIVGVLALLGVMPLGLASSSVPAASRIILAVAGISLISLVLYESMRKSGDALFEEISDELQWKVLGGTSARLSNARDDRPPIDIRVRLRDYARATELPFVPGRYGAAVYAAINIVMVLLLVLPYVGRR
jgi:hypothetical protein